MLIQAEYGNIPYTNVSFRKCFSKCNHFRFATENQGYTLELPFMFKCVIPK